MDTKDNIIKQDWFSESVVENLPAAITVTDLDFKIIYINKSAVDLFGYSKAEVDGKDPIIFNAEPGAREIQQNIHTTVKDGKI